MAVRRFELNSHKRRDLETETPFSMHARQTMRTPRINSCTLWMAFVSLRVQGLDCCRPRQKKIETEKRKRAWTRKNYISVLAAVLWLCLTIVHVSPTVSQRETHFFFSIFNSAKCLNIGAWYPTKLKKIRWVDVKQRDGYYYLKSWRHRLHTQTMYSPTYSNTCIYSFALLLFIKGWTTINLFQRKQKYFACDTL